MGGVPHPDLDGGTPARSRKGVPWPGPDEGYTGECPHQGWGGVPQVTPIWTWPGSPLPVQVQMGGTLTRDGVPWSPIRTWMGYPPIWTWTWDGVPEGVLAMRRSVCLLRSRRRSFLLHKPTAMVKTRRYTAGIQDSLRNAHLGVGADEF